MSEERKLDAKELGKIRKMLDEGSLEKVTFALDLLVSLEAKDEDYAKLFSKTRINKLMKYNGGHTVCSPGTSGVIFNLLANHLHPYPEVFSVLDEAFDGLGGNTRISLTSTITTLQAPAAEILSKRSHPTSRGDRLFLDRLTELSDSAAESLSKYRGESLSLRSLTELSDAAAESLSKHKGDKLFLGVTELSDAAAGSLSKHKGWLSLEGLTELSDAAAENLSKHNGGFLDLGPSIVSDSVVEILSKTESVRICGATELSDSVAESLLKFKGSFALECLKELSDSAAESLSKLNDCLCLDGLTELSDAAAESLSKHKGGFLSLNGLTKLSDSAAESLSKHKVSESIPWRWLSLSGLTSLSDAAAESLSKHEDLGLDCGLEEQVAQYR